MNKNAYYFPHDMDAVSDPKLQAVLRLKGMEGIGAYWCLLERLYRQDGVLYVSEIPAMAWSLHTSEELLRSVISDFGLFDIDGDEVTSRSASARLAERRAKLEQKRAAASKGGKRTQSKRIAEMLQTDSESKADAQADAQVRKGKERKGKEKEIKEDKSSSISKESIKKFVKPTVEEVAEYIREKGYNVDAEQFVNFYESKGWKVGITPMKSWTAAVVTWQKRNSNGNGNSFNGKSDRAGSEGYVPDYTKTSF